MSDTTGHVATPLNALPRAKLREALSTYGRVLCADPRRTEAVLKDLCPEQKREISVLVTAIRERVPTDLLTASEGSTPLEATIARLARRLEDDVGLASESARWGVESWAFALGLLTAEQLTRLPRPAGTGTLAASPQSPPVSPIVSPVRSPSSAPPGSSGRTLGFETGPTIIVAQYGGGEYTTITEALRAARAGHRIIVRPGLYRESLLLTFPVEIAGEGEPEEIVVESLGTPCVTMHTDLAAVRGLTLRHNAGFGGHIASAVDIPGGALTLERCIITSNAAVPWSSCIAIHGPLAAPVITDCRIIDPACIGILVSDKAKGTIEGCEIAGAGAGGGHPGIMTVYDGNPTVRTTRISGSAGSGILAGERGQGTFVECEIFGNARAGVEVTGAGNPVLRRCKIHDGQGSGLWITLNGRGIFEDCELFGDAYAEVAITHGGSPILRRCQIHHGRNTGLFAADGGWGTVEDCDIYANALAGVEIMQGGNPLLRRTRVRDQTAHHGVMVWSSGQGVFEDCDIIGNAHAGVEARQGGNPTLRRCRVNRNGGEAVRVHDFGAATVETCDLTANSGGPWRIDPGCAVRRAGNRE